MAFEPRPIMWLRAYSRRYPGVWKRLEMFYQARGLDPRLNWPRWVYLPLEATYATISPQGVIHPGDPRILDLAPLTALAGWRMTKGIYRFDPDLFSELWDSPFEGIVPLSILRDLPEWTLYITVPSIPVPDMGGVLQGFFAFLTQDMKDRHNEAYIIWDLDTQDGPLLVHAILHLDHTVTDGIKAAFEEGLETSRLTGDEEFIREVVGELKGDFETAVRNSIEIHSRYLSRALSLLFFIVTQRQELRSQDNPDLRPQRPKPRKTKKGLRLFPADKPRTWEVGVRVGHALRRAYERSGGGTATGSKKRPHVRRAHWHGYWVGPRSRPEERRLELRWLPPILVGTGGENIEVEDLPAVIWQVKR